VVLNENTITLIIDSVSFCAGSTYTLPWGLMINTPGTYTDTLKHTSGGCDSIIRKIIASVNTTASLNIDTIICDGQKYVLPSGAMVSSSGIYRDTLKAMGGCDSLVYVVNLIVNEVATSTIDTTISAGETYVLPWGTAVTASGVYRDTVYYQSGCDSLIRIVNLTISGLPITNLSATICNGQNYTLPWGATVTAAGNYRDTMKNVAGLDSAIMVVSLSVQTALIHTTSISICKGQTYTLPWSTNISTPGLYADTLHYQSGCDSIIRKVDIQFKSSSAQNITINICPGQSYILPWGMTITAPGLYSDTLHYAEGCDSITRNVIVQWVTPTTLNTSANICPGQSFTLPWGKAVNTPGTYRDTVFSVWGCDSMIRIIQLSTITAVKQNTTASICAGQLYSLPWGSVASTSGIYSDTIKSTGGCDSMIQTVNLTVNSAPFVRLTKSNDINCMLGGSKLRATGGIAYRWWPSESLSDSISSNPVATPSSSTMYHVQASSGNGCVTEDSILVTVAIGNPDNGYLVSNAFTPDNDGLNDCFGVKHWGAVTDLNFTIYNRWGQIVFQTTDINKCWNGIYKNSKLPTGTFVYLISAKTLCGPIQRKGTVTLIR
jgi:gliding motility-associated-like protein